MPNRIWIWYVFAASVWLGAIFKISLFWFFIGGLVAVGIVGVARFYTLSWVPVFLSFNLILLLLASAIGNFTASSLEDISVPRDFSGRAELISDPRPAGNGISFRVKLPSQKSLTAEVFAYGQQGYLLEDRLAGEWVNLEGTLSPPRQNNYHAVQARLQVKAVNGHGTGAFYLQLANGIRRTLESGADSLSPNQKALFTGIIYGDDRNQSLAQKDLFRATGLAHILAVSGQNIAFVLAIFYPILKRLPLGGRWLLFGLVLGVFAAMTRFEPSVMRASAMACVAFFMSGMWHTQEKQEKAKVVRLIYPRMSQNFLKVLRSSIQPKAALGIATLILILISPSIVSRVAFQLSVVASAGIIFLAGILAKKFFGPQWLRTALAVTISAQLAVAPLVLINFGKIALSALPANILALPAVGIATIWGMTGGFLAGLVGGGFAEVIHIPTKFFLAWIERAAKFSDGLGLGWLGYGSIVLLFIALGLMVVSAKFKSNPKTEKTLLQNICKSAALFLLAIALLPGILSPVLGRQSSPSYLAPEIFYWEKYDLLVVKDGLSTSKTLEIFRQKGVPNLELLIFSNTPSPALVEALSQRYNIQNIWIPAGKYVGGTSPFELGKTYIFKQLLITPKESSIQKTSIQICQSKTQSQQLTCYTL